MPPREGAAAAARSLTWLTSPSRSRDAALALAAATLWGCVLYLALGASAAPRGAVFAVFVLYVAAAALGRLCALFPPTPPLLGHLVAGFALRNLPGIGPAVGEAVNDETSAWMRTAALGVILTRAGIALDLDAIWRLRGPVARLALAPSTAEVVVVTLTTRACVGLPWGYCVVVGFLFGALSPAIVVPSLLKYDEDRKKILCGGGGGREEGSRSPPRNARRGRVTIGCPKGGDDPKGGGGGGGIGEDGLATIGVTAASVDVTYAIAGFGVAWSVIDGSTDPTTAAWKAPVALLAGVVVGVVAGVGLGALFPRGDEDEDDDEDADGSAVNGSVVTDGDGSGSVRPQNGDGSYRAAREDVDDARAFALLTTSQSILFLGSHLDATGGASVGVILASAFAARMYGDAASTRAEKPLAVIWSQLAEPALFSLIGASVDFSSLDGAETAWGFLILACGSLARFVTAYASTGGGGHLTSHERTFLAIAWTPKATVQAALSAIPLDAAVASGGVAGETAYDRGKTVLSLGVLAIVCTAPAGALAVAHYGRRLIRRRAIDEIQRERSRAGDGRA